MEIKDLPLSIDTGKWYGGHIQGIALDRERGHIYCSYTTELIKLDLKGNVLGTVRGFTGHLGCLAMGPDGRVYGSLEYKNDVVGKGILNLLGMENEVENAFYVAIFDGEKITERDMSSETGDVMHTVWLSDPTNDHIAEWEENGKKMKHRYGCAGIDGITFAPAFEGEGMRLLVAYGVYGDNEREDNDYQILVSYDPEKLRKYEAVLAADNIHNSGPERADDKYFVYTGNTTFGVQNMEYDSYTGDIFLSVYRGRKEKFLNYNLFRVAGKQTPKTETLLGIGEQGKTLALVKDGIFDEKNGIYSYDFKYGSTGMISLGGGYFYMAVPSGENGWFGGVIRIFRLNGNTDPAFDLVEEL